MQGFLAIFFLTIVLGLLFGAVQDPLKGWFSKAPRRIFLLPAVLTVLFGAVLAFAGGFNPLFLLLVAAYTTAPTLLVYGNRSGRPARPWLDFGAILLLWLPVEFTTGKELLPPAVWGVANITARGTAITLALFLFLIFRDLKGMKYNLPRRASDLLYAATGFVLVAPILIPLGLWLGFMGPFEMPDPFRAGAVAVLFLKTLLGVALPEELLFRSLIQNWLMQRFGFNNLTLLAAAAVFGASHLNNSPGGFPNWRYVILATIAGFAFGKVFQKSSSIFASATVHAMVNSTRHTFFR